MHKNYVPRAFMVRGVLDPKLGVYYEIVHNNKVFQTFLVYAYAVEYCDYVNSI